MQTTKAPTPAKRAVKRAVKPAASAPASAKSAPAKPASAAKAEPVKLPKQPKAPKAPKLRKKPVRDSFTMPEADFALIATLKARALAAKRETKKSELLRAGLHVLAALDSRSLLAALQALEPVKVGRPKNPGR